MSFMSGFGTGLMNKLSTNIDSSNAQKAKEEEEKLTSDDKYAQELRKLAWKEMRDKQDAAEAYKTQVSGLAAGITTDPDKQDAAVDTATVGINMFGKDVNKHIDYLQARLENPALTYGQFAADQQKAKDQSFISKVTAVNKNKATIANNPLDQDFGLGDSGSNTNATPAPKAPAGAAMPPPPLTNQPPADQVASAAPIPQVSDNDLQPPTAKAPCPPFC